MAKKIFRDDEDNARVAHEYSCPHGEKACVLTAMIQTIHKLGRVQLQIAEAMHMLHKTERGTPYYRVLIFALENRVRRLHDLKGEYLDLLKADPDMPNYLGISEIHEGPGNAHPEGN